MIFTSIFIPIAVCFAGSSSKHRPPDHQSAIDKYYHSHVGSVDYDFDELPEMKVLKYWDPLPYKDKKYSFPKHDLEFQDFMYGEYRSLRLGTLKPQIPDQDKYADDKILCHEKFKGDMPMLEIEYKFTEGNNFDDLFEFLDEWFRQEKGDLFMKPNHLVWNQSTKLIDHFDDTMSKEVKEIISKVPLSQEEFRKWNEKHNVNMVARPAMIFQKAFPHKMEIRIMTVWGKVVQMSNRNGASWNPNSGNCWIASHTIGHDDAVKDCQQVAQALDWKKILPKIEKFARKNPTDWLRVDIFVNEEQEWKLNEIEMWTAHPFDAVVTMKRLYEGWEQIKPEYLISHLER
jgi:hypothetical protein